jgi:hypothetical protein
MLAFERRGKMPEVHPSFATALRSAPVQLLHSRDVRADCKTR